MVGRGAGKMIRISVGQKYGFLTVIAKGDMDRLGNRKWVCRCECGNEKQYSEDQLTSKKVISYGCQRGGDRRRDWVQQTISDGNGGKIPVHDKKEVRDVCLHCQKPPTFCDKCHAGEKYGRLTITGATYKNKWGNYRYECVCDCGQKCHVYLWQLRKGDTKSCGCLKRDRMTRVNKQRREA